MESIIGCTSVYLFDSLKIVVTHPYEEMETKVRSGIALAKE